MKIRIACVVGLALLASSTVAMAALVPSPNPLFTGDAVHEIHLEFSQADWWQQLTANYENFDDPPYLPATFVWGTTQLDSIGVRFKGNSSYWSYYGQKKSFKLDLDEFIAGQEIAGLDKLNLNNCFLDPSLVREKCAYELAAALGMAAGRTNYAAVYINGAYWGLYLLVEQQDQEFIESRWGAGEGGNLWKGEPHGTLEYLGPAESLYWSQYELHTNETQNDWSALVDFVDVLNNTPLAALPDSLHNRLDVESALAMHALDIFTVNLDSYVGRCANYYFYHRDRDGRLAFTKWDQNEAWGIFNQWNYTITQLQRLSPLWLNTRPGEARPLAERLLQVPGYQAVYYGHLRRLMSGAAEPTTLVARMTVLRDLIRPYVQNEPYNMFTPAQFEACMTSNVTANFGPPPGRTIPALQTFITARHTYLLSQIGTWAPPPGLVLNEVMARNATTIADEAGEFEDWIEIANVSTQTIVLTGLGLTDHLEGTPDFVFPALSLAPGQCVVLWADEEPQEGPLHAPFKLDGSGEDIYLTDGANVIDRVTFPALATDLSWGRWPHGTGAWQALSVATPGAANDNPEVPEVLNLVINEFLALNQHGLQDEAGSYEDWVEIYNPGPDAVAMGGLFLTDDLAQTTKWIFPDVTLPAGGFLLVWCDEDPEDGPLHASFKLSGNGEALGLFGRLAAGNAAIDTHVFGPQAADVSEGRLTDGGATWGFFTAPTPGASNAGLIGVPPHAIAAARLLPAYPNPFNPQTTLRFEIPAAGRVQLEVFDARGRRVARLQDAALPAGSHETTWDGRDDAGQPAPSGVYFARLEFPGGCCASRLSLVR